ncbi:DUF4442 domain-containing protein [Photobacterium kishitanii]|uniref:DUF4442 domain-containing protein n=1 Tax=Photobacterium kishitanii TaxID=318456 RepID=A0AAX0Z1W2_9GAMM|nr:DUF4442 domain-containing protein [Photobacterium kishitanii]PSV07416.1 DUF4442 domain-containing protein [Photobacterium kishitanii]PSV17811.1 DUF4442 domain-containing protein [Photobacterium kishitanii]PSV77108.1 DUF4442 domain-containing protein [Photobacterium kishitanii]PSW63315.1 DUF4442 domain-containing protein [Photobacterium kishitanii]PSX21363.1 DUF4442 domain-containing protein [Photobacterium kishitanii]
MFDYYKPSLVKLALNLWPPFWGAGIKIMVISNDFRYVRLRLKLRWWNKNANRTQYGGSIFSLTDPVYSLMLMGILGKQYFVWDKQAQIEFIRPGNGDLFAEFVISEECIAEIIAATERGNKYLPQFSVNVINAKNEVVAQVNRTLYVRKKPQYRSEMIYQPGDIKLDRTD